MATAKSIGKVDEGLI